MAVLNPYRLPAGRLPAASPIQQAESAVRAGNAAEVTRFLASGLVTVATPTDSRRTLLHTAVEYGKVAIVQLLLERGADPNSGSPESPLGLVSERSADNVVEIVRLLLAHGGNVNTVDRDTTLLYRIVARPHVPIECIELLLEKGANPNIACTANRQTALQVACKGFCSLEILNLLLQGGADIDAKDINQQTALELALRMPSDRSRIDAARVRFDVVLALLLHRASISDDVTKLLLPAAVAAGQLKIVENLLQRGANVSDYERPLLFQVKLDRSEQTLAMLDLLLRHKANVNAVLDGTTMLYRAMSTPFHLDLISLLLRRGADPNVPCTELKQTALHAACLIDTPLDVIRMLLDSGANMNALNAAQQTPVELAAFHKRSAQVRLLLEAGATSRLLLHAVLAQREHDHSLVSLIIQLGGDINARNDHDLTPIKVALAANDHCCADTLFQAGAELPTAIWAAGNVRSESLRAALSGLATTTATTTATTAAAAETSTAALGNRMLSRLGRVDALMQEAQRKAAEKKERNDAIAAALHDARDLVQRQHTELVSTERNARQQCAAAEATLQAERQRAVSEAEVEAAKHQNAMQQLRDELDQVRRQASEAQRKAAADHDAAMQRQRGELEQALQLVRAVTEAQHKAAADHDAAMQRQRGELEQAQQAVRAATEAQQFITEGAHQQLQQHLQQRDDLQRRLEEQREQLRALREFTERRVVRLVTSSSASAVPMGDASEADLRADLQRLTDAQSACQLGIVRRQHEAATAAASASTSASSSSSSSGDDGMCVVCLESRREVTLVPCGHLCVCGGCSRSVTICPMCRAAIEQRIRTFT